MDPVHDRGSMEPVHERGSTDLVHDRGSMDLIMDPVHGGDLWTRSPCFVLSRKRQCCKLSQDKLVKCTAMCFNLQFYNVARQVEK